MIPTKIKLYSNGGTSVPKGHLKQEHKLREIYHFIVYPQGEIIQGRQIGDCDTISICYIGGIRLDWNDHIFRCDTRTEAQNDALMEAIAVLVAHFPITPDNITIDPSAVFTRADFMYDLQSWATDEIFSLLDIEDIVYKEEPKKFDCFRHISMN